jgi:hypothetical protein
MAKKRSSVCIRCDGEGSLSKIGDQYFCKRCLAEARRHVYGSEAAEPAVIAPPGNKGEIPAKM